MIRNIEHCRAKAFLSLQKVDRFCQRLVRIGNGIVIGVQDFFGRTTFELWCLAGGCKFFGLGRIPHEIRWPMAADLMQNQDSVFCDIVSIGAQRG